MLFVCLHKVVSNMSNMLGVLYEAGITSRTPEFILVVGTVRFAHYIILVFCVVVFLFGLSSSCILYPMLQVSLDCPFLIASSAFSNVYIKQAKSTYDEY